ncbi:MXAN_6640 family putative metalloprotease [Balneola sp. MJW-20]|uniref:MXAN_6640 family putative metalloprotease n=1 Tax=Gracilimonas aurantiaca TaxID=3234185 RepID=UPI0034658BF2
MSLRPRYIASALLFCTLSLAGTKELAAQRHSIFDLQSQFERGELTARQSMDAQWDLINDPDTHEIIKCATPVFMFAEQHKNELNSSYQSASSSFSSAEQVYFSPSGRFRITYQDSGPDSVPLGDSNNNSIPDYVEEVGIAADYSYSLHIDDIGFVDPISAIGFYNIEIRNQSGGIYGFTSTRNDPGAGTFISIDNDYIGYNPNSSDDQQLGAMRVTVAHEFKHAVQYATNQWRNPSGNIFWSEMDATLMEEIVYDEVNDYYNYIKEDFFSDEPNPYSVFASPASPTPGSYNHITWMLYFAERFSMDLFRDAWAQIEQENTLSIVTALENSLLSLENFSFEEAFAENHLWHYFSNYRGEGFNDYGFDEKDLYPVAQVQATLTQVSNEPLNLSNISPLAARYLEIVPAPADEGLIDLGIDFNRNQIGLGVILYLKSGQIITDLLSGSDKVQLYYGTEYSWQDVDKVGLVLTNHDQVISTGTVTLTLGKNGNRFRVLDPDAIGIPEDFVINQNFPNPFNPSTIIEFELPEASFVKLDIYAINGQWVQTLANEDLGAGIHQRIFDATGLASGTYLYRLRIGSDIYIKKMTYIK